VVLPVSKIFTCTNTILYADASLSRPALIEDCGEIDIASHTCISCDISSHRMSASYVYFEACRLRIEGGHRESLPELIGASLFDRNTYSEVTGCFFLGALDTLNHSQSTAAKAFDMEIWHFYVLLAHLDSVEISILTAACIELKFLTCLHQSTCFNCGKIGSGTHSFSVRWSRGSCFFWPSFLL
jgi:hypothetical protein